MLLIPQHGSNDIWCMIHKNMKFKFRINRLECLDDNWEVEPCYQVPKFE